MLPLSEAGDDASPDERGGTTTSTTSGAGSIPVLSLREQQVLMAGWISLKGVDAMATEPKVDYDKLAKLLGLKNGHTACTTLYNVKKKIKQYHTVVGDASGPRPPRPRTAPPKRAGGPGPATPKSAKVARGAWPGTARPEDRGPSASFGQQDDGV